MYQALQAGLVAGTTGSTDAAGSAIESLAAAMDVSDEDDGGDEGDDDAMAVDGAAGGGATATGGGNRRGKVGPGGIIYLSPQIGPVQIQLIHSNHRKRKPLINTIFLIHSYPFNNSSLRYRPSSNLA